MTEDPMYYTISQVADLFNITRSHAYVLKKKDNWPHHMFGNSLRFSPEDIQAIQVMYQKQTPPETPRKAPRIPKRK